MSGWVTLLLVLIYLDTAAIRRHKDKEAKRAEELRKQAEQRRIEAENARIQQEATARIAAAKQEEAEFWNRWNAPMDASGISYWEMKFESGPENFDDEYYDEFDEILGPEWRRYLQVPPKGGYPPQTAQFLPRANLAEKAGGSNK